MILRIGREGSLSISTILTITWRGGFHRHPFDKSSIDGNWWIGSQSRILEPKSWKSECFLDGSWTDELPF